METITQKINSLIATGSSNADIKKALPKATAQQIYSQRYYFNRRMKADEFVAKVLKEKKIEEEIPLEKANNKQVGGVHYKTKDIQPWDAIHTWGLGFFSGNVVKYVARHREKNGIEDLKKARHYLDKLIEIMEKQK
jgi:hypothetical protein